MSGKTHDVTVRKFSPLTEPRLRWILNRIKGARVLVLGDYCLDIYWFVDPSRSERSLETGLMTNPVREQRYAPGGAGNVANNIVRAGCRNVRALGVIGDDPWGRELSRLLKESGVGTEDVLVQHEDWATLAYNKPHINSTETSRFDFGNFNKLASGTACAILERCRALIPGADAIFVNQQVRQGIHTREFRSGLASLISEFPRKTFIADSRHFSECYRGAVIKFNEREVMRLGGKPPTQERPARRSEVLSAATELFARFGKPIFVTRGNRGVIAADDRGLCEIPGIRVLGGLDTVGAGDSALAGIGLALAAGSDPVEAAQFGNLMAGVTIQKLNQTGTASPTEILALFRKQASIRQGEDYA